MSNLPRGETHLRYVSSGLVDDSPLSVLTNVTNTGERQVSASSAVSSQRSVYVEPFGAADLSWSQEELLDMEDDFNADATATLPRSPARKTSLNKLAASPLVEKQEKYFGRSFDPRPNSLGRASVLGRGVSSQSRLATLC